jgi:hypothetical protein
LVSGVVGFLKIPSPRVVDFVQFALRKRKLCVIHWLQCTASTSDKVDAVDVMMSCLSLVSLSGLSGLSLSGEKLHTRYTSQGLEMMNITGGGAYKYEEMIEQELNIRVNKLDEMSMLVKGLHFLLSETEREVFAWHWQEKEQHFLPRSELVRAPPPPHTSHITRHTAHIPHHTSHIPQESAGRSDR